MLILFSFTSITIHQSRERDRERELPKQNVGLVLAGMGDDGFQNYFLVVIVDYANLVKATGNGGSDANLVLNVEEKFNPSPRVPL